MGVDSLEVHIVMDVDLKTSSRRECIRRPSVLPSGVKREIARGHDRVWEPEMDMKVEAGIFPDLEKRSAQPGEAAH
jgi:hypothetical protein